MACVRLPSHQQFRGEMPADKHVKRNVAYVVTDRLEEWALLSQSLPLLAAWINSNLSKGYRWDKVSVSGLAESFKNPNGKNGGWLNGRYRVEATSRAQCMELFNSEQFRHQNAAILCNSCGLARDLVHRSFQSADGEQLSFDKKKSFQEWITRLEYDPGTCRAICCGQLVD